MPISNFETFSFWSRFFFRTKSPRTCQPVFTVVLRYGEPLLTTYASVAVERPSDRHQRQRAHVRVPGKQQAVRQKHVLRGCSRWRENRRHGVADKGRRLGWRQIGWREVRLPDKITRIHDFADKPVRTLDRVFWFNARELHKHTHTLNSDFFPTLIAKNVWLSSDLKCLVFFFYNLNS